jgi:hypothetical protein
VAAAGLEAVLLPKADGLPAMTRASRATVDPERKPDDGKGVAVVNAPSDIMNELLVLVCVIGREQPVRSKRTTGMGTRLTSYRP